MDTEKDAGAITPEERDHLLSLLTPEERDFVEEVEEEGRAAPKLIATRLDLSIGETMIIPFELTVRIDQNTQAGDTVTAGSYVLVTVESKSGRHADLLVEGPGSRPLRKLPALTGAEGTLSGVHRVLQAGETMAFFLETTIRIDRATATWSWRWKPSLENAPG
jgi:hypothetical protein